jgi:hypothetical protein
LASLSSRASIVASLLRVRRYTSKNLTKANGFLPESHCNHILQCFSASVS